MKAKCLVMFCLVIATSQIWAVCPSASTLLDEYYGSSAVFYGKVLAIKPLLNWRGQLYALGVTISAERVYKGIRGKEVILSLSSRMAGDFPHMAKGEKYLVFADRVDGELFISLCSRTGLLSDSSETIKFLENMRRR